MRSEDDSEFGGRVSGATRSGGEGGRIGETAVKGVSAREEGGERSSSPCSWSRSGG